METSREAARTAIEDAIARLKEVVPGVSLDAPLTLHAVTPYSQTMQSTFGREVPYSKTKKKGYRSDVALFFLQLWFAGLHAVHHWSMVRFDFTLLFRPRLMSATGRFASSQENRSVGGLD
jgi:hypothetical protein